MPETAGLEPKLEIFYRPVGLIDEKDVGGIEDFEKSPANDNMNKIIYRKAA